MKIQVFLLLLLSSAIAAQNNLVLAEDELLKGRAAVSETVLPVRSMGDVSALFDKATQLYSQEDFVGAGRLYQRGVEYMRQNKVAGDTLALLICNQASCNRQLKAFDLASNQFREAIEICKDPKVKPETCQYVAKQYAALLRRQGKDFDANSIIGGAHRHFAVADISMGSSSKDPFSRNVLPTSKSSFNPAQRNSGFNQAGFETGQHAVSSNSTNSTVLTGTEQSQIKDLIKRDAESQLAIMAQREPGETNWNIGEPNITKAGNGNFSAILHVNFSAICTNEKGRFKANMIGYWHYDIAQDGSNSYKIVDKKMPFDTNSSTITKLP